MPASVTRPCPAPTLRSTATMSYATGAADSIPWGPAHCRCPQLEGTFVGVCGGSSWDPGTGGCSAVRVSPPLRHRGRAVHTRSWTAVLRCHPWWQRAQQLTRAALG